MHPLIATLTIDPDQQRRFDELRRTHFPRARTVIGAHVTLFHALPGELQAEVLAELRHAGTRAAFDVEVTDVVSLGRGVAYRLQSRELADVHAHLRRRFADVLTAQDAQPFRPHITVQNKVDPATAKATLAELAAAFAPHPVRATGLALWRYVDGPWEPVADVAFAAP